jgi:dipeptidyl aminopeptidase/acylaminoacyl peptidase
VTENRNSIFVATLTKEHEDGKFELSKPRNALKGTGLESPIEPFGGTDHFDIAKCGLMFTAKDPELPPGMHTKTNIYLINDENFWDTSSAVPKPAQVNIEGFAGASTSPVFSPSGKSLAFLSMRKDGYESDKNHVFIMHDITKLSELVQPYSTHDGNGTWNRSPQSIIWRPDEKDMYFIAEDRGRSSLFQANVYHPFPTVLVKGGAISDVQVLENGDLFISSTSLIDNSLYSLLPDAEARSEPPRSFSLPDGITTENKTQLISSYSQHGSKFGLTRNQIDEIHWPGAANGETHAEWVRKIHAWVVRPSNFDPKKKYPLAYLIHGGPQGAWQDAWSTRWNPASE